MDKALRIREKVEKRYEYWKEKESNSHSIESEIRMSECQHLLSIFDSMQEEPVSENLGEFINNLSKQFPEVSFAKVCKIATRTAKWQKQQMMKDAVVMEAHEEYGELWGDITKCSTEKGKKYKVIIINED